MEKYIPLFPLSIVVYPFELLNLHIFEPRYKQLIQECSDNKSTFGIPSYIGNKIAGYGTEVEVMRIERKYDDGRMDIKTKGIQIFKIITFENPAKNKLYAGGLVDIIKLDKKEQQTIKKRLLDKINELYTLLQLNVDIHSYQFNLLSYEVAHKLGLSLEQEYELLCIESEKERQSYLLEHLEKAIPIVEEMEKVKQLIRMNGHFKHFDPLNF